MTMKIEHSELMNEFISFWFETKVENEIEFETHIDFMRLEWTTWKTNRVGEIHQSLVSGTLDSSLSEDEMVERIKPIVTAAIMQSLDQ